MGEEGSGVVSKVGMGSGEEVEVRRVAREEARDMANLLGT